MTAKQRYITIALWSVLIVAIGAVASAFVVERMRGGRNAPPVFNVHLVPAGSSDGKGDLPVLWPVPEFKLTDQEGKPVSDQDLRGHPWVAAFIFTHCSGTCPMMSQKMASLQKSVTPAGVKLVSFTVDPARDTPEVLKEYARRFNADEQRWKFLTGTKEQMAAVAAGMHVAAEPAADGSDQVVHATQFWLVDSSGQVRGAYHAIDRDGDTAALTQLAKDAEALAKASPVASAAAGAAGGKAQ